MRCDKAGILCFEPTDLKIDDNGICSVPNGTCFPIPEAYEQEEQEDLSFSELQELVRDLANRVAELESHQIRNAPFG